MDFPVSRTIRNKSLFFINYPVSCIAIAAQNRLRQKERRQYLSSRTRQHWTPLLTIESFFHCLPFLLLSKSTHPCLSPSGLCSPPLISNHSNKSKYNRTGQEVTSSSSSNAHIPRRTHYLTQFNEGYLIKGRHGASQHPCTPAHIQAGLSCLSCQSTARVHFSALIFTPAIYGTLGKPFSSEDLLSSPKNWAQ